jgi:hypothetical protein
MILLSSVFQVILLIGGVKMRISKPKTITWWIAVIAGALGVLAHFVVIPVISGISFWLVVAGLALLAIANITKGL